MPVSLTKDFLAKGLVALVPIHQIGLSDMLNQHGNRVPVQQITAKAQAQPGNAEPELFHPPRAA